MKQNDGIYLPPDIVLGGHVFFAVDNVDFSKDTHDGRKTFHGAAMAIYKKTKSDHAKSCQVNINNNIKRFLGLFIHQEPELLESLQKVAEDLATAGVKSAKSEMQKAQAGMVKTIQSSDVITRMKTFDDGHDKIPEFQVFRQYRRMVMEMMSFVSAVRTGDWLLHLTALKSFTKYFFAHDRINYARMILLYY